MDRPLFRRHIPGLDGVRGIAIALVVVYHFVAGWPYWTQGPALVLGHLLRGSWIGVDVFFVLSGYLITGILLDERGSSDRWKNFIVRRALRIFPAYYVMLLVSFLVVPPVSRALGAPGLLEENGLSGSWPWFVGYLANVRQLYPPHFPMALSVTWSLAVEEQFYLLWPWLIWYASPSARRRWILLAIGAGAVAKVGWSLVSTNPIGLHYLTPCCIDEFAWGALVAVLLREDRFAGATWRVMRVWGLRVGLPTAVVMVLLKGRIHPVIGSVLLSSSVGWATAAVIMTCIESRLSLLRRITEARGLRILGKYSYGIYLTHALFVPWFAITRPSVATLRLADVAAHALAFVEYAALTALASWVLYSLVERPALRLARAAPAQPSRAVRATGAESAS